MTTYQTSVSISAPRDVVWKILSDVAAWPEWLPTVAGVESLDGSPLAIGRRYKVRQPSLQPVTWVVTELENSRRFSWQARSPGVRMFADHVVDDDPSGAQRVVLKFSFGGPLGGLLGKLYRSITERYIATEAATLKLRAESST